MNEENKQMVTRNLTVRFLTPAFLGNADQSGQWRTPPFKHLLREWWRVAWAAAGGDPADIPALRREEARLFGAAADGHGNRSLLRLRLEHWNVGKLQSWNGNEQGTVHHPEVQKTKYRVGPHAYLGYGPLDGRGGTKLKTNAAIQADERNTLKLAIPEADAQLIDHALLLLNAFGALGGRSRNGWGSVVLEGDIEAPRLPLRDWKKCLDLEWAHAIGQDDRGPLIWQTRIFDNWRELMRLLAEIKIGLRTQFAFNSGKSAVRPEDRHWLSYPVTNHSVKPWDSEAKRMKTGNRLPNSLRFKVVEKDRKLLGRIFHVPCLPPSTFRPDMKMIANVWEKVHTFLDERNDLTRSDAV